MAKRILLSDQRGHRKASLLLCAIMLVNTLVGMIGMTSAMAAGHDHHGGINPEHHDSENSIEQLHDMQAGVEHPNQHHNHSCCDETIKNPTDHAGCAELVSCAAHCAQPLPVIYLQPCSLFLFSDISDPGGVESLLSVELARHYKPPRAQAI